ncbi:hypothetical protein GCM10009801_65930 [Streptomyces albiaxialis]|uniref:Uncharacterized protein n=1 Tax=Streptomyces albiaxialis TaxID=329523 RepID=A0ABN2WR31_9ACTN
MSWLVRLCAGLGPVAAVSVLFFLRLARTTARPLPAYDRTPPTATVLGPRSRDETESVEVAYEDDGGVRRTAGLADLVHHSGIGRFAPGTRWQVSAFRAPGRGCC